MHIRRILLLCLLALSRSLAWTQDDLCESRNWFEQAQSPPSLLCKGVKEAAFNKTRQATSDLERVIHLDAASSEGYRAHEVLLQMSFRQGRYLRALGHANAMLANRPDAKDILNLRSLLVSLSAFSEMTLTLRHSFLPYEKTVDRNPHLRVSAQGKEGLFYADTGANISVMSDVEARALGLTVNAVSSRMGDISGSAVSLHVANVDTLQIGSSVLRHVSFIILPATQPPFNEVPTDQQALLGIQVLLALQRIHVAVNGDIEIAGPRPRAGSISPLVFHQSQPVVQMSFQGKPMLYTMDSGATHTTLNPLFAQTFAAALTSGTTVDHALTGLGGTTTQTSLQLDHLDFKLADALVSLNPAVVLMKKTTSESEWTAGNLGYDLMEQTAPFTIDFSHMVFETERTAQHR